MSAHDAARSVAPGDRGVEQTLGRSAALLDALAAARRDGLRFTDLVAATGFSKATVHRLLAGLVRHGFVEADGRSQRVFLGYRLAGWGAATRGRHGLVERAAPLLDALAQASGDTVYLILRDGAMTVCASRHEGPFPIRALPLTPGDRNALGVGSGSLALLAFLSNVEVDSALSDPANVAARERRDVSEAEVRRQIALERRRGYASSETLTPGMTGLGVPVPTDDGSAPIAAVSVSSIAGRLREPRRSKIVEQLNEVARLLIRR